MKFQSRIRFESGSTHRIMTPEEYQRVTLLRRSLTSMNPVAAMESLVQQLGKYESNEAFLAKVATYIRT